MKISNLDIVAFATDFKSRLGLLFKAAPVLGFFNDKIVPFTPPGLAPIVTNAIVATSEVLIVGVVAFYLWQRRASATFLRRALWTSIVLFFLAAIAFYVLNQVFVVTFPAKPAQGEKEAPPPPRFITGFDYASDAVRDLVKTDPSTYTRLGLLQHFAWEPEAVWSSFSLGTVGFGLFIAWILLWVTPFAALAVAFGNRGP